VINTTLVLPHGGCGWGDGEVLKAEAPREGLGRKRVYKKIAAEENLISRKTQRKGRTLGHGKKRGKESTKKYEDFQKPGLLWISSTVSSSNAERLTWAGSVCGRGTISREGERRRRGGMLKRYRNLHD